MNIATLSRIVPVDPLVQQAALSDLFFNYDHPELDALYGPPEAQRLFTDAEERAALRKDAEVFASTLENAAAIWADPDSLVEDFLARR